MASKCGPPMCNLCGEPHPLLRHTNLPKMAKATVARVKQIEAQPLLLTGPKAQEKKAAQAKKKATKK